MLLAVIMTTVGLVPVPAQAATPLTGRLIFATGGSGPATGVKVRLRTVTSDGPGTIVDSDLTSSEGTFSLDAGASPDDEYYVQVVAGRFQGGYVGGSPKYVQPGTAYAVTYAPHAALGTIRANPAYIRGVVVNAKTKKPVSGIKVAARSKNDGWQLEGTDYTNRAGIFVIRGIECEDDCYLRINGAPKGYEVGYRACNGSVVASWEDACASPIGSIGKVRLQKS